MLVRSLMTVHSTLSLLRFSTSSFHYAKLPLFDGNICMETVQKEFCISFKVL